MTLPDLLTVPGDVLGDRDRGILDFEAEWQQRAGGRHDGGKEEAIRGRLGLTPPRYYQLLARLVDSREALAYEPVLVARLRRLQETRRAEARTRLGAQPQSLDR